MNITPDYRLSPNYTIAMLARTDHREYITTNIEAAMLWVDNLARLAREILEPMREMIGPFFVSSAFRSPDLNRAIGGSKSSQHCHGQAADTVWQGRDLRKIYNRIAFSELPFSQCIYEFGQWVHIGIIDEALHPGCRRLRMLARSENGKTVYEAVQNAL